MAGTREWRHRNTKSTWGGVTSSLLYKHVGINVIGIAWSPKRSQWAVGESDFFGESFQLPDHDHDDDRYIELQCGDGKDGVVELCSHRSDHGGWWTKVISFATTSR